MSGPNTLRELQRWAENAPPGTMLPAASLAEMLAGEVDDTDDRLSDLTLAEAAEKLGKAPSTIRAWLLAGELRGYKVHRSWRITRAAIAAFLEGQRNPSAESAPRSRGQPADLGAWQARL